MAGPAFDEAEDTLGLDIIEQVEANGGEYEVVPEDGGIAGTGENEPFSPQGGDTDAAEAAQTGRPRNPDGTFAPRTRQEAQAEQNRVPISAIQEERRKRQEIERRLNEREREWAAFQGRLQAYQEQQQAEAARRAEMERQAQEQAMMPDRNEDPIGYQQYMLERQQREIENLRQAQQAAYNDFVRQQQQSAQAQAIQDIGHQVQTLQTQFAMQQPDYPNAFAHLAQTRYNELALMGYNDQQIPQILEQERTMIVTGCLETDPQTGRPRFRDNPARVAYELAMARGWSSGQAPVQSVQAISATNPNSTQMGMPYNPNADRVQQMQQRVNQASRLPNRAPTEAPISMETLAKMDEREWNRMMESDPDLIDALMGAR